MADKMLVTQALDERDLLVKKIQDKISKVLLQNSKELFPMRYLQLPALSYRPLLQQPAAARIDTV